MALVVACRQASVWGLFSPATIAIVGAAAVLLAALIRHTLRRSDPVIDLRMFASPTFAVSMLVVALLSMAQFARLNFLPIELQVVRNLDAQHVGLLLAPAALGVALTMPLSGWVADRIGARLPVMIGLSIVALTIWQLAHLNPEDSTGRIVRILIMQGIGSGLVFIPTAVAAMKSLPARFVAQASAVNALNRQLAGAIGIAVLSAVLVADLGAVAPVAPAADHAQNAYNTIFLVSFGFVVAALAVLAFMPGRRQTKHHHAIRASELLE